MREVRFLRNLCDDLGYTLTGRLAMGVDNQAAIDVAKNDGVTSENKHFERINHLVRSDYQHGRITLVHVSGDSNVADLMTKPVEPATFKVLRYRLYGGTE